MKLPGKNINPILKRLTDTPYIAIEFSFHLYSPAYIDLYGLLSDPIDQAQESSWLVLDYLKEQLHCNS